jgi:hypothetical protein
VDIEQLKLILETLATMGESGKDAFIWWLVLDKVLPVFGWIVTFSGFIFIALRVINMSSNLQKLEELRDALGVGSYGSITNWEIDETLKKAMQIVKSKS